jgi:LEM3 (ligand-effect modulator 3) family / CDC50 family
MGLFNRKKRQDSDSADSSDNKKEKGSWKRPASLSLSPYLLLNLTRLVDTAFKQQRLKAWQPILTPKTVLPTLFIIGIIFAPIGALLIWGSSLVSEITFDYTDCENLTPSTANDSLSFTNFPSNKFSYRLRSADSKDSQPSPPRYAFLDNTNNSTVTDVSAKKQCVVEFDLPADLDPSVLFYYKLTNFYQNHRRYVKSLDSNQLKGKFVSTSTLQNSDCNPLGTLGGKDGIAIYPCGLIANSLFNG